MFMAWAASGHLDQGEHRRWCSWTLKQHLAKTWPRGRSTRHINKGPKGIAYIMSHQYIYIYIIILSVFDIYLHLCSFMNVSSKHWGSWISSIYIYLQVPGELKGMNHSTHDSWRTVLNFYAKVNTGWWFGTLLLFSIIWDVIRNPLTNSIIFQMGRSTTNQNMMKMEEININ